MTSVRLTSAARRMRAEVYLYWGPVPIRANGQRSRWRSTADLPQKIQRPERRSNSCNPPVRRTQCSHRRRRRTQEATGRANSRAATLSAASEAKRTGCEEYTVSCNRRRTSPLLFQDEDEGKRWRRRQTPSRSLSLVTCWVIGLAGY